MLGKLENPIDETPQTEYHPTQSGKSHSHSHLIPSAGATNVEKESAMPRLFFATDVHGSEICWRKFLNAGKFYNADVLILGGDMTGKALVPIQQLPDGTWKGVLLQQEFLLHNEEEGKDFEKRAGSS